MQAAEVEHLNTRNTLDAENSLHLRFVISGIGMSLLPENGPAITKRPLLFGLSLEVIAPADVIEVLLDFSALNFIDFTILTIALTVD